MKWLRVLLPTYWAVRQVTLLYLSFLICVMEIISLLLRCDINDKV
jgi:hypothetical protein